MNETAMELDQAAFQRVWSRVMPQDRPDCPFTLDPLEDLSPTPQPLVRAPLSPLPCQQTPQSIPCLGEASMGELPRLEELIRECEENRRTYRALSRRMGGRGIFSSLTTRKDRQLRLRAGFRAEQHQAAALMEAAQAVTDPCLAQLYLALAEEDREHADRLRAALERR